MQPAIVLLEFDSVAVGILAGDAMVKRAPLKTLHTGTVQPGRYLVLAGGDVGDLEEALAAAKEVGSSRLRDEVFLPDVHSQVVDAITGTRQRRTGSALGVFETKTVPAVIRAADRAVKGTDITVLEVHLADGLGGKGYALFAGDVADVEAAIQLCTESLVDLKQLVAEVVIPQIHPEMAENLGSHPEFGYRISGRRRHSD
ncbi:MAG: BMC domain-containing protein [Acidobacteriota bacterium]|nr:BMC domain-containing protein [Acidobacteriota bacterium]